MYIGEAESIQERLIQHIRDYSMDKEKYYWNTAVLFTGCDLNKALIRYLENRFVELARTSKRYLVLTKNTYRNTVMKESQIAVMEEFIDNVMVLINALGYKVLEPIAQSNSPSLLDDAVLSLNVGNAQARAMITTEEFVLMAGTTKALIRCGSGIETEIKLIVIDEGHLLGSEERYIKNEMFLTLVKEYASRNQIRILLLSAVLPNSDNLAQWIAEDIDLVAKSEWKPALERLGLLFWNGNRVRLEWKSEGEPFNPNFIQKKTLGFGARRNPFPNDKKEAIAATAVRLAQNGTVMIYSARANSIDGLAKSVLLALGEQPKDYPWDKSLWNVFESVCAEELSNNDIILKAAKKGIICHKNRLPTLVRIVIEELMRSKSPLIIIASHTLGQGVNIGISTVIVSTPYYSS